jgi:hypothetical protein
MAEALFITPKDLKEFTQLSGNMDEDKILQYIKIAQDTHVENLLGTDLKEALQDGITNSNLTGDETALLNNYVKDLTIHWAMVELLSFAAYTIGNKGIYKHFSENSETVTKEELDALIERHRARAEVYSDRFYRYMCHNSELFPEYNSNTNEDISPIQPRPYPGGWML